MATEEKKAPRNPKKEYEIKVRSDELSFTIRATEGQHAGKQVRLIRTPTNLAYFNHRQA